jgi:hypothetical protein
MEMYRNQLLGVEAVCGGESEMGHPISSKGTLTTDALFVAALARMVPTASRHTVRERPGCKARQEKRMSIHHRVRRGSDL